MSAHEHKFNHIMEQSRDNILCFRIDKPISAEGYAENFLPRLSDILEKYDNARILLCYEEFKGWEKSAAIMDLQATAKYGSKIIKIALVNAPEKDILLKDFRKKLVKGEIEFFDKGQLDDAIKWVSN